MRLLLLGLIFITLVLFGAQKPSWCTLAKKSVEKRICNSSKFWEDDKKLVDIYNTTLKNLSASEAKELKKSQREWWQERNKKCEIEDDECIFNMYTNRISFIKNNYLNDSSVSLAPVWCDIAKEIVEKRVCANSKFWKKDKELVEAYQRALKRATREQKPLLKKSQKEWWQERNKKCEVASDECILDMYNKRIAILNSKDSLTKPLASSQSSPLQNKEAHTLKHFKKGDTVRIPAGTVIFEMGPHKITFLLQKWAEKGYAPKEWEKITQESPKLEKEIKATVRWCGKMKFAKELKENVCEINPLPRSTTSIRDPKTNKVKEEVTPTDTDSMLYLLTFYGVRERDIEPLE